MNPIIDHIFLKDGIDQAKPSYTTRLSIKLFHQQQFETSDDHTGRNM
jgi:hypothetical protein